MNNLQLLKPIIKKFFHLKKNRIVSFKSKKGKIIRTGTAKYRLFLDFKNHFQKIVTPIKHNLLRQHRRYFKFKLHPLIKYFRKLNYQVKRCFLYKFYIDRRNFIRQMFIKTFMIFLQQLYQIQFIIKDFPRWIINFSSFSFNKKSLNKVFDIISSKYHSLLNMENFNLIKLKLAIILKRMLKTPKFLSQTKHFFNKNVFQFLLNQAFRQIRKKEKQNLSILFNFKIWVLKYRKFLKEKQYSKLTLKKKKQQEYAENYRLLKEKFNNSLTQFLAYKKARDKFKLIINKKRYMNSSALIYRLKTLHKTGLKTLFRKISLIKFKGLADQKKEFAIFWKKNPISLKMPQISLFRLLSFFKRSKRKLKTNYIKLSFISKRLFNFFLYNIIQLKNNNKSNKFKRLLAFLFNINKKYKTFILNKVKRHLLYTKKLNTNINFINFNQQLSNINVLKNKIILIKSNFNHFIQNNKLYFKMNLLQNLEVTNLLKNTSDILRAESFTHLLNKEEAYYQTFYKQQAPLQLLTTVTGHNIYLTLFNSKPYHILWKASAGMLGLKHFRRAKKHQITFRDLITRCQLFMARHRALLQRPLHIVVRYLNYFGTKNFLSYFLVHKKPNYIFENYKNIKIYHFYRKAKHLANNYAFQFMSMIWSRMKNSYAKVRYKTFRNLIKIQKRRIKAFPELLAKKNFFTSSFVEIHTDPSLKNYLNKNPFVIKK